MRETVGISIPLKDYASKYRQPRAPPIVDGDGINLPQPGKIIPSRPGQVSADSGQG